MTQARATIRCLDGAPSTVRFRNDGVRILPDKAGGGPRGGCGAASGFLLCLGERAGLGRTGVLGTGVIARGDQVPRRRRGEPVARPDEGRHALRILLGAAVWLCDELPRNFAPFTSELPRHRVGTDTWGRGRRNSRSAPA